MLECHVVGAYSSLWWQKDGTTSHAANTPQLSLTNALVTDGGTYYCYVKTVAECVNRTGIEVTVIHGVYQLVIPGNIITMTSQ